MKWQPAGFIAVPPSPYPSPAGGEGTFFRGSSQQPIEIKADMAIAHRFSGKGGEDKGPGGCGGCQSLKGSDKITVELIQGAAGNELLNLPDHAPSPARFPNIAESCSMRARGGRSANTPQSGPKSGCIPLINR